MKTLLELEDHDCRYPFGETSPYTFCGCPTLDGLSYCEPHQRLTHRAERMTPEQWKQGQRTYRNKMIAEVA